MNNKFIADIDQKEYYSVIFSSVRTPGDNGYSEMADEMVKISSIQSGFLGIESTRDGHGNGITVSYWNTIEDINKWKNNTDHLLAQKYGQEKWYKEYALRITKIIRHKYFSDDRKSAQQGDAPEPAINAISVSHQSIPPAR